MSRWMSLALTCLLVGSIAHAGEVVEIDGLKSRAPDDWKMEEPTNRMRVLQMKLAKAEGDKEDAELIVFYFGRGGGGGVKENIDRWKATFAAPEGKTIDDVSKIEKIKIGEIPATVLTISGTYKFKAQPFNPNSPTVEKTNYKMTGVVFESPNGPFFFRLTGPAKTMDKHEKAFRDWLTSFK